MIGLPYCADTIPYLEVEIAEDSWFPLHGAAWSAYDCWQFLLGGSTRSNNPVMGQVHGRLPLPVYRDETDQNLDMLIVGDCDMNRVPYTGGYPGGGMAKNLKVLKANVTDPMEAPFTGRRWRLTTPDDEDPMYAHVQVLRFTKGVVVEGVDWNGYTGQAMTATLSLRMTDWFRP